MTATMAGDGVAHRWVARVNELLPGSEVVDPGSGWVGFDLPRPGTGPLSVVVDDRLGLVRVLAFDRHEVAWEVRVDLAAPFEVLAAVVRAACDLDR